jgi:hypothetical protein
MMNKIKLLCTALLPNIIIVLYIICFKWAQDYSSTHFTIGNIILVQALGNIAFGVFLLFVCRNGFKKPLDSPVGYILGVIIMPLAFLLSYIPGLTVPVQIYLYSSIPYYFIFASVYIGLIVYSVYMKRKASV